MYNGFWSSFIVLFIASILGSVAILPYSLRLIKGSAKNKPLKLPRNVLLLLSVLQNAVLFAILIGIGLIAAHQIGLNLPVIQTISTGNAINQTIAIHLFIALFFGLVAGIILFILDLFFLPYFPKKLLDTALATTQLENFTASFYGGINEELFARLFGISAVAWLLSRIWHTDAGLPTPGVLWIANSIMAVIFALGHLPALKSVTGNITPAMLGRALLLNIPLALICGWLFWNYGIIAAMITHFTADIIYHVGGTVVLRLKFAKRS